MNTKKVRSTFQLLASKVESIDFKNDFTIMLPDTDIERQFDVSYEIDGISVNQEENNILGSITLHVLAELESGADKMLCQIRIQGGFVSEETQDVEEFKKLLELNGCATLYSIARGLVLNISAQACLGAHVLLPMINIFKLKEEQDSTGTTKH